jgi:hypothetical protein
VAIQEYNDKLKEKHDKIEILDSRSATEKKLQKRKEHLLLLNIYDLGLAIVQNTLKERQVERYSAKILVEMLCYCSIVVCLLYWFSCTQCSCSVSIQTCEVASVS